MEVIEIKTQQFLMMSNLGTTDATSGNLSPEFTFDEEINNLMGE